MPENLASSVFHDVAPEASVDAAVSDPLLAAWVDLALNGEPAELLILGPSWSGKTYAAWAAYNALAAGSAPPGDVAMVNLPMYGESHNAANDVLARPIIICDPADYGDSEYHFDSHGDPDYQPKARAVDEPEIQAMLAVHRGNVNDLVTRLVFSTEHARLLTATSPTGLERALGVGVARTLLEWPTLHLARRDDEDIVTW